MIDSDRRDTGEAGGRETLHNWSYWTGGVVYRVVKKRQMYLELSSRAVQMYTGDNGPSRITGKCDEICFVLQITTSDVILNHSPLYQIIAIGVI